VPAAKPQLYHPRVSMFRRRSTTKRTSFSTSRPRTE
jgi:hypothetical protein